MTLEDPLNSTLSHLDKFDPLLHATNAKLMEIILKNVAEIADNPDLVNEKFGLKLGHPKVMLAMELEFLSKLPKEILVKAEPKISAHTNLEALNLGDAIKELNFEFDPDSLTKMIHGQRLYKHEIKTSNPTEVPEQLYNYARLFTAIDIGVNRLMQRFSGQLDVSICDTNCTSPFPLDNDAFRNVLGHNMAKFIDEGLVLLDTKKSIEGHLKDKDDKDSFYNETDRVDYYDGGSELLRCLYQVSYRNEDKPVDDDLKGISMISTSREEIRRTVPGESKQNYMVCDPMLAATALITASINYTFKHPEPIELTPYNYRGTEYGFHMTKFKKSELLAESFSPSFLDELAKKMMVANIVLEKEEMQVRA